MDEESLLFLDRYGDSASSAESRSGRRIDAAINVLHLVAQRENDTSRLLYDFCSKQNFRILWSLSNVEHWNKCLVRSRFFIGRKSSKIFGITDSGERVSFEVTLVFPSPLFERLTAQNQNRGTEFHLFGASSLSHTVHGREGELKEIYSVRESGFRGTFPEQPPK